VKEAAWIIGRFSKIWGTHLNIERDLEAIYHQGLVSPILVKEDEMMTHARSRLVSVSDTPYDHCISRCVRRAFLCGEDTYTGQSFEHRRDWFIEVCAYAVMSNHCHLVLNIVPTRTKALTLDAVIERWCRLYRSPDIVQRYRQGDRLTATERESVTLIVEGWRTRLSDLSWFMRCLNEYIARRANAEDRCTGRFWEGALSRRPYWMRPH
jgi:REP element-mobilizing transposase RayT